MISIVFDTLSSAFTEEACCMLRAARLTSPKYGPFSVMTSELTPGAVLSVCENPMRPENLAIRGYLQAGW